MTNEESPNNHQELIDERVHLASLVATKRTGREALVAAGHEVEPEEDDMDMQDLLARMKEIDDLVGEDPNQSRLGEI